MIARAAILPRAPLAAPTTPATAAWTRVRDLRDSALLAARIEALAVKLDAPGVVREASNYIAEIGARLELATKHARRLSSAAGAEVRS